MTAQALAPVILSGQIVRLEPLTEDHIDDLLQVASSPELWQYTMTNVLDRKQLEEYVQGALAEADRGSALPFVTLMRNRVIGSTRFASYERVHRRIEIGWTWIAPAWQRTGANVEAKLLMMTHAFEQLGCHRVEFKTDVLNQKSRNALLGIGATEEGVLRQHMFLWNGRLRDTIYYSVLAPEWPKVKQKLQARLAAGFTSHEDYYGEAHR